MYVLFMVWINAAGGQVATVPFGNQTYCEDARKIMMTKLSDVPGFQVAGIFCLKQGY